MYELRSIFSEKEVCAIWKLNSKSKPQPRKRGKVCCYRATTFSISPRVIGFVVVSSIAKRRIQNVKFICATRLLRLFSCCCTKLRSKAFVEKLSIPFLFCCSSYASYFSTVEMHFCLGEETYFCSQKGGKQEKASLLSCSENLLVTFGCCLWQNCTC